MADMVILAAQARAGNGTRHARALRKKGLIPAVVYGHKKATLSLALPADEFNKAIRQGARVVDLNTDGKTQKALIRELQWDPLGHDILHVDFARVSEDERITLDIRVEVRGTPPGVAAGGSLVQQVHSLHVECPVISVPESIRVNVGELQLNQAIHVSDLNLPPGVVVKNDPETIIVTVVPKAVEAEETPGVAAPVVGEQAEPEVIGRKKEEEAETEE